MSIRIKQKNHSKPKFQAVFRFGGQGWIRTIEVVDGRFTVDTIILYKPSKLEQLGKYQYLGVYLIHISNTQ